MRILHTADWHLGDRLGRIDRTDDLRRSVERIAAYCDSEKVDVLLVAGDIFSELSRPDSLRESIEHLQEVFEPFLLGGGTILAITGNHDNEVFCQTLRLVMTLAAPASNRHGELCPGGRFYLATNPTFLRLTGPDGHEVQFVLTPYPTPSRYLQNEQAQRYANIGEKNAHLHEAYARTLAEFQRETAFRSDLPTVLAAHVHVQGARLPSLFRISEEDSILFSQQELPRNFAYIALGHIHQAQAIMDLDHVRYCGSIERLDLGEQHDEKSAVVLDVGPAGLKVPARELPLEATPIHSVQLRTPLKEELNRLRQLHPNAKRDLVNIEFTYTAGVDNLEETLRELEEIFPRWYHRHWTEANALGPVLTVGENQRLRSFADIVRDYLRQELTNHPDAERDAVLERADGLLREVAE
jgi:exonuclease SbcD